MMNLESLDIIIQVQQIVGKTDIPKNTCGELGMNMNIFELAKFDPTVEKTLEENVCLIRINCLVQKVIRFTRCLLYFTPVFPGQKCILTPCIFYSVLPRALK